MLEDKKHNELDALINEVLKNEPAYVLPDDFADILAQKVEKHFVLNQYLKEFLIYLAVIAGIVILSLASAFVFFEADWKEWLSFVRRNIAWMVAANVLLLFVLFADRVVLPYFMRKSMLEEQ